MAKHVSPLKDSDLLQNHRAVVENYLTTQTNVKPSTRRLLLRLYDQKINKDNIRYYLNRKIKVFIIALAQDNLHQVTNYHPAD